jgi:hypothetical protein
VMSAVMREIRRREKRHGVQVGKERGCRNKMLARFGALHGCLFQNATSTGLATDRPVHYYWRGRESVVRPITRGVEQTSPRLIQSEMPTCTGQEQFDLFSICLSRAGKWNGLDTHSLIDLPWSDLHPAVRHPISTYASASFEPK